MIENQLLSVDDAFKALDRMKLSKRRLPWPEAEKRLKAMALKKAGEDGPNPMMEDGSSLHPNDPDADEGKGPLSDRARRKAPSGALDHAGELPSRERSRTRY